MKGERGVYLDEIPALLRAADLHIVECEGEPVFMSPAEYQALATLSTQSAARHARRAQSLFEQHAMGRADGGGGE
jgi:hypothetical protein